VSINTFFIEEVLLLSACAGDAPAAGARNRKEWTF
jgi:hypothetical protein